MWRRRISNWANAHQKKMIAGMFCVMAAGIIWLIAGPREEQVSSDASTELLYSGFHKRQHTRPMPADMLEMWQLYSRVQTINPDSLTAQDSALLQDIDKQLNKIIHE